MNLYYSPFTCHQKTSDHLMQAHASARHDLLTIDTTLKLISIYQPRVIVCMQWNVCFVSSLLQFDSFGVWEHSLIFIVSYVIYFLDSWQSENTLRTISHYFSDLQNEDRTGPSKATWKVKGLHKDREDYLRR